MSGAHRRAVQIIEPQFVIEGAGVLLRRSFGPTQVSRQKVQEFMARSVARTSLS